MKEKLFKNIVLLLIVNLLVKPIWILGIEATVHNRLGSEVMGHYLALLNLSIVYQIILDLGLNTYTTNAIAKNQQRITWLFPSVLIAKFILSLLYLGIVLCVGLALGYSHYSIFLLFMLGLVQLFNSLLLFIRSNIVGLQAFKIDSFFSILDKFLMILLCGYLLFLYAGTFTIEHFIYAQIVSLGLSSIVGLVYLNGKIAFNKMRISLPRILQVIRKSLPYALLIFVMSIYFKADVIILEYITQDNNPQEPGIYYAKYRFLDIANNMTGVLIAGFLLPFFSKNIKDKGLISNSSSTIMQSLLLISIMVVLTSYFYGYDLLSVIYTNEINRDGMLLFIVMMSYPFYCINYIYSTLLTAQGAIAYLIRLSIVAAIISMLANVFFVPTYGAYATAIISILVHGFTAATNYYTSSTKFGMKLSVIEIVKNIAWILLIIMTGFVLKYFEINTWLGILIFLFIGLATSILLKIIRISKLLHNIK